jgi:hypothetical protein
MATFTVWFSQTDTSKAWFEAESKEQALALLEKLNSGEIDHTQLDNLSIKLKEVELEFDPYTLEQIDEIDE